MGITTIIDGRAISNDIRATLKQTIASHSKTSKRPPHLVVFLVGNDPASMSYVRFKKRAAKDVGIKSTVYHFESSINQSTLIDKIHCLNKDESVHGIMVQLPLPNHFDRNPVIEAIDPSKDVDALHPLNIAKLHTLQDCFLPCTPKGIITLLNTHHIPIQGQHAVVIGRSNLVGKPIAQLLLKENASVSITHRYTKDLTAITKQADILISAVGKANFVTKDMVKEGAVCIDVGLSRVNQKLTGDFDFDALINHASYITQAPGGVGPMTVTSLLENTWLSYLNHI
jgi:methylenetetrahydrofolate dehydrogenase (NADP+)/methenyltetrahydrofolate cyclohydrolase